MKVGEMKKLLQDVPDDSLILIPDRYDDIMFKQGALQLHGYAHPDDDTTDGILVQLYGFGEPLTGFEKVAGRQYPVIVFHYEQDRDGKEIGVLYESR